MKRTKLTTLNLFIIFCIQSCAEQVATEKKIESAVKKEATVNQDDVVNAAREHIYNSPNLTQKQKTTLLSIEENARSEIATLKEEINKSRMVMVKSAFEPSYNAREVELLKNKILKLERKKIKIGLNAFIDARNIIDPIQINETKSINKVFLNQYLSPY
jgi:outer membrane phospholipase A